jgi:hypothetical protein
MYMGTNNLYIFVFSKQLNINYIILTKTFYETNYQNYLSFNIFDCWLVC